jgi:hypothetical protein
MSRVFKALSCLLNSPLKYFYREKDIIETAIGYGCYENDPDNFESRFRSVESGKARYDISNENGWAYVRVVR